MGIAYFHLLKFLRFKKQFMVCIFASGNQHAIVSSWHIVLHFNVSSSNLVDIVDDQLKYPLQT